MISRRALVVLAASAGAAGCYQPELQNCAVACTASAVECAPGWVCSHGRCGPDLESCSPDAPVDSPETADASKIDASKIDAPPAAVDARVVDAPPGFANLTLVVKGKGIISGVDGRDCKNPDHRANLTCDLVVANDTMLTLEAQPNDCLDRWAGGCTTTSGALCMLTVPAAGATVIAQFKPGNGCKLPGE